MQSLEEREKKVVNVLETYFSDASLQWDKVVLNKMLSDSNQMISFDTLCKLPKFKNINATPSEIKESAEKYSLNKLKIENDKIGRIKPYIVNKKEELDEWSIYVEGLEKPYNNEHKIIELFNSLIGHVSFFRIPPNQYGNTTFFGYCFIEFDNKDNVQKAVNLLNNSKLNIRVMSKLDWIKYKDEYLELLNTRKEEIKQLWDNYNNIKEEEEGYTKGIIVFVDHLHLQSSKTTAIKLLEERSGIKIAFMNTKKKGLSSTHIRLNNSNDAKSICDYFNQHFIIQETNQDMIGKEQDNYTIDCLKLRIIQGKEEEIYWENQ